MFMLLYLWWTVEGHCQLVVKGKNKICHIVIHIKRTAISGFLRFLLENELLVTIMILKTFQKCNASVKERKKILGKRSLQRFM